MASEPHPVSAPTAEVLLDANLADPDGFYEQWLSAHQDLSIEESFELNARLLMLLANQIGDAAILARCVELARQTRHSPDK